MSLADKLKKKNEEREVAGKHPLIAMGLSREVRDAYFRGVALAAFIDDGRVDDSERAYLRRIGLALNLPEAEVAEMLDAMSSDCKSEDEQLSLLEEISSEINQPQVVKLFLSEFSLVWKSHASNPDDLAVYRTEIAKMMGVVIPDEFWRGFDAVFNDQESAATSNRILKDFDLSTMMYMFPRYAFTTANSTKSVSTSTQHSMSRTEGAGVSGSAGGIWSSFIEGFSRSISDSSSSVAKTKSTETLSGVHIKTSLCVGCGACLSHCAQDAIDVVGDCYSINGLRCNSCGTCIPKCPRGAIACGESMTGEYQLILRYSGENTISVIKLIMEITGMSISEAAPIAKEGGRCFMTKLSYEKAIQYQKQFRSVGAVADVIKA